MSEETTVSTEETVSTEQIATDDSTANESTEENSGGEAESTGEEASVSEQSESFTGINPDELPAELKDLYKNMQKDYSQKTTEVAELKKKAQLYDQMQQERLIQERFPKTTNTQQAKAETQSIIADKLGVDLGELEPEQQKQIESWAKIVDATVEKRVAESITPIQHDLQMRDYQSELADVQKRYPDFDEYRDEVRVLVSGNPQLSFEQAYKVASFENQKKAGRTEAYKNLEVKKKQSSPKGTSSPTESNETVKGFEAAFDWARRQVGKS